MSKRVRVWYLATLALLVVASLVQAQISDGVGARRLIGQVGERSRAGITASGPVSIDTLSFLFCTDLGWNNAAVDSGYVCAIGDTGTTYTDTFRDISGGMFRRWYVARDKPQLEQWNANYIATRAGPTIPHSAQTSGWLWWDLSKLLPFGLGGGQATILEAYIIISPYAALAGGFAANEYVVAALDTSVSATVAAAAPAQSGKDATTRRVTWQMADNAAGVAWSESLTTRNDFYDYGVQGARTYDPTYETAYEAIKLDVTRSVQAYLDLGLPNGGFAVLGYRGTGAAITISTASTSVPMLVVKVATTNYRRPWGQNYLAAVILGTDDFDTCNTSQGPLVKSYGWKMTIAGGVKHLNDRNSGTDVKHMSVAQVLALHGAGHEIAYHSYFHRATNSGAVAAIYNTNINPTAAGYDTLLADCRPDSFYARLGLPIPANRTFVTPGGYSSSPLQAMLDSLGYNFVRSTGSGAQAWHKPIHHLKPGQSVNLMNIGMWVNTTDIFGSVSANDSSAIAEALRDAIQASNVTYGGAPVIIFWHDTHDSDHYAGAGANNVQVRYLLDIIANHGRIRVVTYQEALALWRKQAGSVVGALQ